LYEQQMIWYQTITTRPKNRGANLDMPPQTTTHDQHNPMIKHNP
jgi:hypothetical protein